MADILIVEDDEVTNSLLAGYLNKGGHTTSQVFNGLLGLESAIATPPDLIIMDVKMPEMDGYEVLYELKEHGRTRDIPVILITCLDSVNSEETGLKLGAADYIVKPFHPNIVLLRVENHLRFVHQRQLLEKMAGCDGLTEINNRWSFDKILALEWRRCKREGLPLSLAMVDVDFFKPFNDHYGHVAGDKALHSIAQALSGELNRSTDTVSRYGGEEFVLLFPDTDSKGAQVMAKKLQDAVIALRIQHEKSSISSFVTISIGGVTKLNLESPQLKLVETADSMLYQAKAQGRNCVVWSS